ncbi:RasGEF domain containing protein [Balamuthia mandrillaris]
MSGISPLRKHSTPTTSTTASPASSPTTPTNAGTATWTRSVSYGTLPEPQQRPASMRCSFTPMPSFFSPATTHLASSRASVIFGNAATSTSPLASSSSSPSSANNSDGSGSSGETEGVRQVLRSMQINWSKLYTEDLKAGFALCTVILQRLKPLQEAWGDSVAEWVLTQEVLLRFNEAMLKMVSLPLSTSVLDTEQAQKQRRKVLLAVEEVKMLFPVLAEMTAHIDPAEFQFGSPRRRKQMQLLNNKLYQKVTFLYTRWLGDLRDYKPTRNVFKRGISTIRLQHVFEISGAEDELNDYQDEDEESDESEDEDGEITRQSVNTDLWRELENVEHDYTQCFADREIQKFWDSIRSPTRFMVGWDEFLQACNRSLSPQLDQTQSKRLQEILDFSSSGMVSIVQFKEFLKGFGTLNTCLSEFCSIISQEWFHGYISHYEAERVLDLEPAGTFIIRLRDLLPGTFAIALVDPSGSKIIHVAIESKPLPVPTPVPAPTEENKDELQEDKTKEKVKDKKTKKTDKKEKRKLARTLSRKGSAYAIERKALSSSSLTDSCPDLGLRLKKEKAKQKDKKGIASPLTSLRKGSKRERKPLSDLLVSTATTTTPTISATPTTTTPVNRFVVQQGGTFHEFASVLEVVAHFRHILRDSYPVSKSYHHAEWFFGDLSGNETKRFLSGQSSGTFLVRFSASQRHCLATAYLANNGKIVHSLLEKTARGFRVHGSTNELRPEFSSVNELIAAYQSVLAFPFVDTFTVTDKIHAQAKQKVQEKLLQDQQLLLQQHLLRERTPDARRFTDFPRTALDFSAYEALEGSEPSKQTLSSPRSASSKTKKVFGVALEDILRTGECYGSMPLVVEQAIMYLYAHAKTPGLFKVSSSAPEVRKLIDSINRGEAFDFFKLTDPHIVAHLLKAYLRELPHPLIPIELFNNIINIDENTSLEELSSLMSLLPAAHLTLLKYLMKLLLKVSSEPESEMTAHSLAVFVGPNILRRDDMDLETSLQSSTAIYRATEIIILRASEIFTDLDELSLESHDYGSIVLMPNRMIIKSATKDMLVQALYKCPPGSLPSAMPLYSSKFRLTYRSFLSPLELLSMLISQYFELSNSNTTATPVQMDAEEVKLCQIRLCSFLKKWTKEQSHEFKDETELLKTFEQFVSEVKEKHVSEILSSALQGLSVRDHDVQFMFSEPPPKPIKVPNKRPKSLLELKPIEIARQMALIEYEIFRAIQPHELVEKAWQTDEKSKRSPNVMYMVTRFNKMVNWLVAQVVQEPSAKKRQAILLHYVKIARHCRNLNNFNGAQQILATFGSSSISRLLEAKKNQQTPAYLELKDLFSPDTNFGAYRKALKHANPPLVPYLGRSLTDLTFIEDANKTILQDSQHVNFRKCYLVAEVIQEVQRYQQTPYNLKTVPIIRDFLLNVHTTLTEDDAYKLSLEVQPRKAVLKHTK